MFTFPYGIKIKHVIHKKIIIKSQQNPFDKQLQMFNHANHVPKRTSRDKKERKEKNKTGKIKM